MHRYSWSFVRGILRSAYGFLRYGEVFYRIGHLSGSHRRGPVIRQVAARQHLGKYRIRVCTRAGLLLACHACFAERHTVRLENGRLGAVSLDAAGRLA
jgi:hypothetical protein